MDIRKATIEDIKQYLTNGGLINDDRDFEFAKDNDAFKYVGYSTDRHHKFLLGCHSEDEDNYFVAYVYVWLGARGDLVADYGGAPVFESDDPEEVIAYIEKRCN